MSTHAEKHRHHAQGSHALAMQRRGAGLQRRLHKFEEGEHDALAGKQLAQLGYELLEGPRPERVARAVGEENDGSFGHAAIICEVATSR